MIGMNKYVSIIIAILIVSLSVSSYILYNKNQKLKEDLSISISNEKAFITENSLLEDKNRIFKFTVEQLNYYNDSILEKMNEVRKELKIKNKDLKQMQYLLSEATKKDTIVFRDTLFREPTLDIDTIIGDKWYSIRLGLKYPNLITTNPTFISEKYIIVNKKKETINPPKKFFLFRWFQRKHWVMEVNIKEKNPYIKEVNNKFVEIIE
jgi:hypothetical protein|nr:MAG TPA: hypothetical protein [Crassvirales sp.]